jgi:hypothetical protein
MVIGRSDEAAGRLLQWRLSRREIVWSCFAEPIWAGGPVPRKQAGHMIAIAPSVRNFLKPALELEGPSTHEEEPCLRPHDSEPRRRSTSVCALFAPEPLRQP